MYSNSPLHFTASNAGRLMKADTHQEFTYEEETNLADFDTLINIKDEVIDNVNKIKKDIDETLALYVKDAGMGDLVNDVETKLTAFVNDLSAAVADIKHQFETQVAAHKQIDVHTASNISSIGDGISKSNA